MDKYKDHIKNYECLLIPTKNIFDMHEDELGCTKITVGLTDEDENEVLMVFADDVAVDGDFYQEGGEDE